MENKPLILIVEDEKIINEFLKTKLETENYRIISTFTGKEALTLISSHCPDLILLDLGLPDIDGIKILTDIRTWSNIPVIIVSARSNELDIIDALDKGADDYVTKPFNNSVLMARIRMVLRKNITQNLSKSMKQTFGEGALCIDYNKRIVTLSEKEIHLTPIEYKIITILAQNSGKVMTYNTLCNKLWGLYSSDTRTLRVNMANIRRKIELNSADPTFILTEVGVGYRMIEDDNGDSNN